MADVDVLVQLTDLHVQSGPGDAAASERCERAFAFVRSMDPAPVAVLITGDLTNTGTDREYERLAELLPALDGFRVLPAIGNHDARDALREVFASTPEISGLGDMRHVQYAAEAGSFRVLVLDTQHTGHDDGKLCDTRTSWLREQLAADPARRAMIVMHHPPMSVGIPSLDALGIRDDHRARFASLIADAPGVELIVAGHVHRPVTGRCGQVPVFACPSVFFPALPTLRPGPITLVDGPVGIGVHVRAADGGIASHVRVVGEVPGVVTPIPAP